MTHPASNVYIDGAGNAPTKSSIRQLWRDRALIYVASATEVQAMTTQGMNGFILPTGIVWTYDAADTTTAHDGITCIVSADGYRYKPRTTLSVAPQNLLINARMNLNQRGFAGGALTAGAYGYDRWRAGTGGCDITSSSTTDTITHASGNLEQLVEWAAWDTMRSRDLCFSITDLTGGPLRLRADGVTIGTFVAGSGTQSLVWNRGATNANMTIELLPTSGAVTYKWPSLTIGSAPVPWNPRATAMELALAERYFIAYGGQGGAVTSIVAPSFAQSAVLTVAILQLRTRMRTSPTVTFVGTPADDFALQVVGNTALALSALALGPITPHSVQFNITPSVNRTPGDASSFRLRTTTARIYLDAEL